MFTQTDFSVVWDFLFELLGYIFIFAEKVVSTLNMQVKDLADILNSTFVDVVLNLLEQLGIADTSITLLEFTLSLAAPFIIVWGIVKFFVGALD